MGQTLKDPDARAFEDEERDLPEIDTQLTPEGNWEIERYGKTYKSLFLLVPRGGIEPPTRGFSVLCSTD